MRMEDAEVMGDMKMLMYDGNEERFGYPRDDVKWAGGRLNVSALGSI